MKMLKVMEKRRSIREYKEKPLESKDMELVKEYLLSLPQVVEPGQVRMQLLEGKQVFERLQGVAGYNGIMIEAPYYVLITAKAGSNSLKAAGYAAEWFVLNVTRHEIGTCWISANHQEARIHGILDVPTDQEVVGLLALGYAKGDLRVSNIYAGQATAGGSVEKTMSYRHVDSEVVDAPVSGRLAIADFVYDRKWGQKITPEKLEQLGYLEAFYYMRLAPSAANRQPWKFVICNDCFVLAMSKDDGYDDDRLASIEAGIAMLYFEVAMHGEGYPGHWKFDEVSKDLEIDNTHFVAGVYSFM